MKKNDIEALPEYFDRYINEIEDLELSEALNKYGINFLMHDKEKLINIGDKVYETGKWTIKDILQHLIDAERIFTYRALRFARNDKTKLPGFEENDYASESKAANRTLDELLEELETVRKSTINLYKSFDNTVLRRDGICNGRNTSVLAIGFIIAAHMFHHTKVIRKNIFLCCYNETSQVLETCEVI